MKTTTVGTGTSLSVEYEDTTEVEAFTTKGEISEFDDFGGDDDGDDEDNDYYYFDEHDDDIDNTSKGYSTNFKESTKMNFSHSVSNTVSKMQSIEVKKRTLHTSRDDRATSEQCLDPRTRLMLFKMLSNGILDKIDGCLSTGKEANVYYAKAGKKAASFKMTKGRSNSAEKSDPARNGNTDIVDVSEFAIKIYKTSILVFKDRDKYVSGEHRWRKGYCKSNPRKMVKVWAEKELRNYRRIHSAGIPCPTPIFLKAHILLMEFLGDNGWPSPRLKDAGLSERHMREAYVQTILIMRHLYQRCKLVHGDLSEYNLLWHKKKVYVIDVSQSVETDHPSALDFLRKDASNVNDYFSKVGNLNVMTTRQLFEFITTVIPIDENNDQEIVSNPVNKESEAEMNYLEVIMKEVETSLQELLTKTEKERRENYHQNSVDEAVFMSSFLPRSLNQVADYDIRQIEKGEVEETYAHAVAALTGNHDVIEKQKNYKAGEGFLIVDKNIQVNGRVDQNDSTNDIDTTGIHGTNSACDNDDSDQKSDNEPLFIKIKRTQEELDNEKAQIKAARKANKKAVREEKAEKRLTKIKKKDKKRAIKKAKAGNRK
mmetsp:Transcript_5695/g.14221  ORF Transcript_5695/g.14221 Transcript_5695/m.14221 type:complete len:597 (-) Transcript_5695:161-1951(-)